jgi:hypothetical protein
MIKWLNRVIILNILMTYVLPYYTKLSIDKPILYSDSIHLTHPPLAG